MIFHKAGKYNGDENSLPQREHPAGSVPFKECQDMKTFSRIANGGCFAVIILLAIPFVLLGKAYFEENRIWLVVGFVCTALVMLPHEMLHAICFEEDVYYYNSMDKGMLFVVGTEDMSKTRFIFMSMLPNLVFGFLPFIVFLVRPDLVGLGLFGLICLGSGFGDYINVFNALTQVPGGAKIYMSGLHTYWHKP